MRKHQQRLIPANAGNMELDSEVEHQKRLTPASAGNTHEPTSCVSTAQRQTAVSPWPVPPCTESRHYLGRRG